MSELPDVLLVNRAIIIDDDRMLLLQRSSNDTHNADLWEFPGGKVDKRECVVPGRDREVYEETGLLVESKSRLVYVDDEQLYAGKYEGKLYVVLFHLVQRLSGDVQLSGEHTSYSWDTIENALDRSLTTESRRALGAFNESGLI